MQNTNGNTYNNMIGTMIHTWILYFCPLKKNEMPLAAKGKHDVGVTDVVVASFNTTSEVGSGYNSNGLPKQPRQHIDNQFHLLLHLQHQICQAIHPASSAYAA